MKQKRKMRIGHIGWLMRNDGPDTETVAWCDINEQRLARLAVDNPDIKMYTDWRKMLAGSDLDLVVVSTPNFTHAEIAIAALEAGKHVFLEKPMGISRAECNAILEAQKRGGGQLGIDFEIRVSPCALRLKQVIDSGEYGALRRIEYIHHQGAWLQNQAGNHWRLRRETTGGEMLECPIHYVDIMRFLAGSEIESVQAVAGPNVMPQYGFEDNMFAHFFFASGVLGTLHNTHTHSAVPRREGQWKNTAEYMNAMGHDMSMIFTLTGGSIGLDFLAERIMFNRYEEYPAGTGGLRCVQDRVELFDHAADIFFHDSDKMRWAFINRVLAGQPPVLDPLDAWKSHMVCLAVDQSVAENSRRVTVDYTPPKGW